VSFVVPFQAFAANVAALAYAAPMAGGCATLEA
jgi:hypothetical protein